MSIQNRVNRLQKGNKGDICETIIQVMKYFGWSLKDIQEMTIPSFLEVTKLINKIEKDQEKERKKSSKKKW